ncbi:MAG: inositol monophosphatase family protein [Candidatus Sumerlaeota bacterium]
MTIESKTIERIHHTMRSAAVDACEILRDHLGRIDIEKKGAVDLVTQADRMSEEAVIGHIRQAFPDHAILAEESGASSNKLNEGFCWVIDPLDGTTNYAHAVPVFSVSIGVLLDGQPFSGLIVEVMRDDWFFAHRGNGATLNEKPIHVSETSELDDALVLTGFPHDRRKNVRHFMDILEVFLNESRGVLRLGSAAIDLAYVACGRAEAFYEEHLSPWDVAAGSLIVEEAGGRISGLQDDIPAIFGKSILATNGVIHPAMQDVFRRSWKPW